MGKINLTRAIQGLTVINFGMGVFNTVKSIKTRNLNNRIEALVQQRDELRVKISELQEIKIESLEERMKIENKIRLFNDALSKNNEALENIKGYVSVNTDSIDSSLLNQKVETAENTFKSVSEAAAELVKNIKKDFIGGDEINLLISNLQNWYNSLGLTELLAAVNFSGCLVIVISLFSIILVLYSDFLINKFNLNQKYPKLKKIIDLRATFKKYYLILDFSIIFFVLITMMGLNLLVFI